jgi:hypothetical protein
MELCLELYKLKCQQVPLSFEPSLDMPLWKLRHEYEGHEAMQTLVQRVHTAKQCIKLSVLTASTVLGKFLKLNGWDAYVVTQLDTGMYDAALEQIYKSVAGRGRPSPWLQIGLLVLGTLVVFHIENMVKERGNAPNPSMFMSLLGKLPQLFSFVSATPTPVSAPSVAACKPMHAAKESESASASASASVPKKKKKDKKKHHSHSHSHSKTKHTSTSRRHRDRDDDDDDDDEEDDEDENENAETETDTDVVANPDDIVGPYRKPAHEI